jgi:hypothetical protein
MPRRSQADISILSLVPGKGRPVPPRDLDQAEARAWRDVVDAMPAQWLDPAGQLVLRRIAAQIALAERLEGRLRRLGELGEDPDAMEAERLAAAAHRQATKTIVLGLSTLRATPRSRMAAREGRSRFERSAGSRPWEVIAKKTGGDDGSAA